MTWKAESKRHSIAKKYGRACSKDTRLSDMSSEPKSKFEFDGSSPELAKKMMDKPVKKTIYSFWCPFCGHTHGWERRLSKSTKIACENCGKYMYW